MTSIPPFNMTLVKANITDTPVTLPHQLGDSTLMCFLQQTLQYSTDEVFWMQADSRIVHANHAACTKLEYRLDELVGKYIWEWDRLFPKQQWPMIWDEMKRLRHVEFETRHQTKFGRIFPVFIRAHLI